MSDEVVNQIVPEAYADFVKYRTTGETPQVQEPTTQDSAPADAPKETVTPVKAATESGTEEETQEHEESAGKEAQKRIRQLLARVKELESKSDVTADSSTAKDVKAESSPAKSRLTRPQWSTWESTPEEFDKATGEYEQQLATELEAKLEQKVMAKIQYEQSQRELAEAEKDMPGVTKAVDLVMQTLTGKPECNAVISILGSTKEWMKVAHFLGQEPETVQSLAELAKTDPVEAMCEAVRLRDKALSKTPIATPAPEPKVEVQTRAPQPFKPLTKSAPTDSGLRDDLDWKEWRKRREAQLRS